MWPHERPEIPMDFFSTRSNHFFRLLLMISFEDLILVFYIWILDTTLEVIIKKFKLKNIYYYLYCRRLTQKNYEFKVLKHLFGPLCHAWTPRLLENFLGPLFVGNLTTLGKSGQLPKVSPPKAKECESWHFVSPKEISQSWVVYWRELYIIHLKYS